MSRFTTRVELHNATYQDYVNLHAYMSQEGFTNTLRGDDGTLYHLPPAEYELNANFTAAQVRDKARKAAARTQKSYAVVAVERGAAAWVGLAKA